MWPICPVLEPTLTILHCSVVEHAHIHLGVSRIMDIIAHRENKLDTCLLVCMLYPFVKTPKSVRLREIFLLSSYAPWRAQSVAW